ncbi:hypothetical protein FB45DRAFT_898710 [Roridomyces roridus]|uniref:Mucoidy inhibitor A n=1 Tax=Roridomyces roridus TaxID=1738132 RepID=A0AAD7FV72_9AGAR|nr:hypothetical protein FB45DRAFT_898710 [Roridomyces roridus]
MTTTTEHPPAFEPSAIPLQSLSDSKIISVNLYPTRAEVTRLFRFAVKMGQNQVNISGLPNCLESESLRVEGRGAATIHDVTVSMDKREAVATTSPKLDELLKKRESTSHALTRCEKSIASLEQYLGSLTVQHLEVTNLDTVLHSYEATGERLDAKKAGLTEELRVIDGEITDERQRLRVPHEDDKLRTKAAIGVFAKSAGDVEIALVYAVPYASWTAFYDIRVDMSTKENPVTVIYKAAVKQSTGESWDDVPLQLETSTPTFGLDIPKLPPWDLYFERVHLASSAMLGSGPPVISAPIAPTVRKESRRHSMLGSTIESDEMAEAPDMGYAVAAVSSKGNISATFRVPGLASIPCDGDVHNFTIVELSLKATMSWVSVPKVDPKTHLKARITNASEYTLLNGTASVYVDGSFISRSVVPAVSPQESFDCPLGIDTSIRITYHPLIKKLSHSGFYNKSANYVFSQRIAVFNTKSVPIEQLKIVDQIPISQNAQIEVKLTNPALNAPSLGGGGGGGNSSLTIGKNAPPKEPQVVKVGKGVKAQWDGVDEPGCEVESLGVDRKVNWICSVGAQDKLNLSLEWEVSVSPAKARVVGL